MTRRIRPDRPADRQPHIVAMQRGGFPEESNCAAWRPGLKHHISEACQSPENRSRRSRRRSAVKSQTLAIVIHSNCRRSALRRQIRPLSREEGGHHTDILTGAAIDKWHNAPPACLFWSIWKNCYRNYQGPLRLRLIYCLCLVFSPQLFSLCSRRGVKALHDTWHRGRGVHRHRRSGAVLHRVGVDTAGGVDFLQLAVDFVAGLGVHPPGLYEHERNGRCRS